MLSLYLSKKGVKYHFKVYFFCSKHGYNQFSVITNAFHVLIIYATNDELRYSVDFLMSQNLFANNVWFCCSLLCFVSEHSIGNLLLQRMDTDVHT